MISLLDRPLGSLAEVAVLFLRLGTTSFGGPAAHIAMMEDEVVRRRGWLTREQFLDYVGATNLIPGPNSTELAIHIGYARAGWPGLLTAGGAFIIPAVVIVMAIAWGYLRYGGLPAIEGILYGIKPVVMAIVAQALWGLGRSAVKTTGLLWLALGAVLAVAAGVHELAVLGATGGLWVVVRRLSRQRRAAISAGVVGAGLSTATTVATFAPTVSTTAAAFGLWPLFLVFAKIGAVLFGSGYVLLAFLRADLVERLGWLTERLLLDAAAVGQMTPGPVFTTATFIGYVLGGPAAAGVATLAIFLPAFVFVAASTALVPRLRRSPLAGDALDGINVASLALMAVVGWQLGRAAVPDAVTAVIAAAALGLLLACRVNSAWLILGGGLVGWLVSS